MYGRSTLKSMEPDELLNREVEDNKYFPEIVTILIISGCVSYHKCPTHKLITIVGLNKLY